jgi:hypothetical protein
MSDCHTLHERGPVSAMFVSRDREKLINAIIYFLGVACTRFR